MHWGFACIIGGQRAFTIRHQSSEHNAVGEGGEGVWTSVREGMLRLISHYTRLVVGRGWAPMSLRYCCGFLRLNAHYSHNSTL